MWGPPYDNSEWTIQTTTPTPTPQTKNKNKNKKNNIYVMGPTGFALKQMDQIVGSGANFYIYLKPLTCRPQIKALGSLH